MTAVLPSTTPGTKRSRPRGRRFGLVSALVAALLLAVLASLAIGAKPIPLDLVWSALWHPTGTEDDIVVR